MAEPQPKMSLDAFLAWEAAQPGKHEFLAGEVFAMTGTTKQHNRVAGNLYVLLRAKARGGSCEAFIADVCVVVEAADALFYPDVVVTCDPRDAAENRELRHPSLIVEVLSESTASFDQGVKAACYKQLPSLQEYLLVDPERRSVTLQRRSDEGSWTVVHVLDDGEVTLQSLELTLPLDAIYGEER